MQPCAIRTIFRGVKEKQMMGITDNREEWESDPEIAVYCTADHKPHWPITGANHSVRPSIPQV